MDELDKVVGGSYVKGGSDDGHLILPPGSSGQITGTNGETLTFSDVKIIQGLK